MLFRETILDSLIRVQGAREGKALHVTIFSTLLPGTVEEVKLETVFKKVKHEESIPQMRRQRYTEEINDYGWPDKGSQLKETAASISGPIW